LQLGGLDVSLLLVGTGEMESELRELVHKLRVRNVCFSGFVNQRDLPAVYAACDVFVLPSTDEPWGLVVNEVMCAGLPVVVSAEVGCAEDLVLDGRNGRQFDARNVPALADALRSVLADPQRAHAFGCESLAVIREWGYSQCLDGLSAAVRSVRER
jgi:glycosyltransferase involved in cell wall biosynthesis